MLGLISAVAGAVVLFAPGSILPGPGIDYGIVRVVGFVFLVFGFVRILNSIVQLRRLNR